MMNLRNKLIRLAHEKPELRKDLLPLLKLSYAEKTARSMTKTLATIFAPVEPFCKDYQRFLYGTATLLQYLYEWNLWWSHYAPRKITFAEVTDGIERETDTKYYSVPTDITVHYEFPIKYDYFINEFSVYSGTNAAIKDKKGFEEAMKQVLADSSKTKILAKILADSIKYGMKYDNLENLVGNSTLLDKELIKLIEAEEDAYFTGSYLGPHPKKLLGYTAKATGSEFVLKIQLEMEVDPDQWEAEVY